MKLISWNADSESDIESDMQDKYNLGGIQQLRGPNNIQFYPTLTPTPSFCPRNVWPSYVWRIKIAPNSVLFYYCVWYDF